jgi:hypothetical protein
MKIAAQPHELQYKFCYRKADMKIHAYDVFEQKPIILNGTMTTEHPANSNGQPVLSIAEWGGEAMSHENWVLTSCSVVEISDEEYAAFMEWCKMFPGQLVNW